MRFNFFRKSQVFYDLLEELVFSAEKASLIFQDLLNSWSPTHPAIQEIKSLERSCDKIVHQIMVKLHKTFVTPIDREDIHTLASKIDDLIDIIESLTSRMLLYQIKLIPNELKDMSQVLSNAISILKLSVQGIRNLLHSKEILEYCVQIHTLENQGDCLFEKALGNLFLNSMPSLDVIKWLNLYESLENGIDRCEDIADIIWGIVGKYG